ncbi:MAG: hypothetical protein JSS79_19765 [Bacteroidetes bacterium]|nr:hypothetical protein [Bacteroidota bacterium]
MTNRQFKKNDLISVPAIYICLLLDKGSTESLQKRGWLVVDGLLFLAGAGEIKVALESANWLRKLMVIADVVGSGSNLLLDAGLENQLPKSLVDKWRWVNLALSLHQGISSVKKIVDDLAKESRDAKKILNASDQELFEKKISNLEDQVSSVAKGADDVANVILKTEYQAGEAIVFLENGVTEVGRGGLTQGYLELSINVKLGNEGARVASGTKVFDEIFTTIQRNSAPGSIKGVKGIWYEGLGDNLETFNKLILEKVNTKLMTIEEAALQTFTGKMAQRKGFTRVKSISGIQNSDGTYKIVNSLIFE